MALGSHCDAEELLCELGVTYLAGFTNEGRVPRKYGATVMPTTEFIRSNGEIFERRTGQLILSFLARATTSVLAAEGDF